MDTTTAANWANIIAVPIAIIFGLATLVLAIILYRRSKQRRALSCIFGDLVVPIEFKASGSLPSEIELSYKGRSVHNLFIVRAKIQNTGNLPIRAEHVVEPVTLKFEDAEILREPQIVSCAPANMTYSISSVADSNGKLNAVVLNSPLLNPADFLFIEFVCTGKVQPPRIMARIEGVSQINTTQSTAQTPGPVFVFIARGTLYGSALSVVLAIPIGAFSGRAVSLSADVGAFIAIASGFVGGFIAAAIPQRWIYLLSKFFFEFFWA